MRFGSTGTAGSGLEMPGPRTRKPFSRAQSANAKRIRCDVQRRIIVTNIIADASSITTSAMIGAGGAGGRSAIKVIDLLLRIPAHFSRVERCILRDNSIGYAKRADI